jgi:hypothetical protein
MEHGVLSVVQQASCSEIEYGVLSVVEYGAAFGGRVASASERIETR